MSTDTVPDIFEKPGVPYSTTTDDYSTTQIGAALPTVETASVVNYPMGGGAPSSDPLNITFSGTIATPPSMTVGTPITPITISTNFSGGPPPKVYSVFSGTLPPGLALNASTGVVSGTPTTPQAAANVVFKGTDNNGNSANSNGVPFTVAAAGDPVAIAIVNAVQAWWDFEQNDGTNQFLDSKNSNHLTAYNNGATTTSAQSTATGMVGRGMQNQNAETSRTALIPRSNTNLDFPNSDWSIGGWFKLPLGTSASARFLMGRVGDGSGSTLQAYLAQQGSDGLCFIATTNGVTQVSTAEIVASTTVPMFIVATFDRTNNLLRLRIRSTAPHTTNVTQAFPGALFTTLTNANFCVWDAYAGDTSNFSGTRCPVNAMSDSCFYVNKALTDAEVTMLYNAGAGLSYAQLRTLAGM